MDTLEIVLMVIAWIGIILFLHMPILAAMDVVHLIAKFVVSIGELIDNGWGKLHDKYGNRVIIIPTAIGAVIVGIAFGLLALFGYL